MGENDEPAGDRLLAGRYRVAGQLGRGGMGTVWRAVDEVLGREVAVKELRSFTDADGRELADQRLRMRREGRAAARVRHRGVVAVHDVAEHEGRPVIVMELVDGPSLDAVLRGQGPLDPAAAARIGAEVAEALAAAHRAGVLHRDVKPSNILLERGGRVVLTDFGIAALEEADDGASTRLTGSGELVGSLDYLAPERARGDQPGPPADVWALGATLYAAVEGVAPFRRTSTWSTITAIVVDPLPEPRRAGPLAPVLAELMAKDPAARADLTRAAELLHAVAEGRPLPPGSPDTMRLGRPAPPPTGPGVRTGPPHPVTEPGIPTPLAASGADVPHPSAGTGPEAPHAGPATGPGAPHAHALTEPGVATGPAAYAATRAGRPAGPPLGGFGAPPGPLGSESPTRPQRPRRRRTAAAAGAAAAVLLAGAGVTYLVTSGDDDGGGTAAAASPSAHRDGPGHKPGDDATGTTGEVDDRHKTTPPSPNGSRSPTASSRPSASAPGGGGNPGHGGTSGSSGGGGTTSGGGSGGSSGGGDSTPAPSCHPIGGGKYNCDVWRTAASYDGAHRRVGTLNMGTNYFFCQVKLSHRETYGRWTNVWWAKTDDDSGNAGVYVSDVYIKGGDNDKPVPGLPVC